jgi:molybdopterin converting factor small subunit
LKLTLLAFGIARDILGSQSSVFTLSGGQTVGDLKSAMTTEFDDFAKLKSIAFAVNEAYVGDSYVLNEGDEVVIIPPVSGG